MLASHLKLLLAALCMLSSASITIQTPVKQNYTEELLRRAKAAEMSAFFRKGELHCENFYKEVCGNWKLTYPATQANKHTSYLGQIHNLYVSKCTDLLKADGELRTYHKMLKNFFNSCSNEKSLKKEGLKPLLNAVDFKGGWPNISSLSWYESEYDWLKVIADMRRKLGVNIFIGLELSPDLDGKNIQRIKVGAPILPLGGKLQYLNDDYEEQRNKYKHKIATQLRKHFSKMPENWANEVANQVLDVEKNLAKGLNEDMTLTAKQTSREQAVAQLRSEYGNFVDLSRYLTLVFNRTISEPVYENTEQYMINLVEVIKQTPKLTIANYTMWRVLEHVEFAGHVNDMNNDFYCAEQTIKYFPKHVEDMYDQGYNAITFGQKINSIFEELRDTLKAKLNTLTKFNWMSSIVRQRALEKVQEMKAEVVHHYHVQLEQEINEIYPVIKSNKYYENLLHVLQWQTKEQLSKLNQNLDIHEETVGNELPKYILKENKIRIPIAFLQPTFLWDPAYPNALKYSTIGVLLAQQMLYGFVGQGQEYDKRGDPNPWWDADTKKSYEERVQCFAKQYGNYNFQGKLVNDPNTALKAVVDAGALNLAYQTFNRWMNNAPADVLGKEYFPHIDHKPHQLFFLGFGQMHCADYYLFVENLTELPERLRVNGALLNLEEFGNQFNCEINSKMNPKNKCAIF